MTNSPQQTKDLLDELIKRLQPDRQQAEQDARIDMIAAEFTNPPPQPTSTTQFNQIITDFVQKAHEAALPHRRTFPPHECFAIAHTILDRAYAQDGTSGYHLALLDVIIEQTQDMEIIIQTIAEGIKEDRHRNHQRWIYAHTIETLDTKTKLAMAKEIQRRNTTTSDERILASNPALLATNLSAILQLHIATTTAVLNITKLRTKPW